MAVSWSPDGKLLAVGTFDGPVILWNVATNKELVTLQGHSSVAALRVVESRRQDTGHRELGHDG